MQQMRIKIMKRNGKNVGQREGGVSVKGRYPKFKSKPGKLIFVYGTLRRGFYNHERTGLDRGELVGVGMTHEKFYPYLHSYGYPGLVSVSGTKLDMEPVVVLGELYRAPDDVVEGITRMEFGAGYHVAEVRVQLCDDDRVHINEPPVVTAIYTVPRAAVETDLRWTGIELKKNDVFDYAEISK
jgi:gamma-glutamylcyclotransferase (GGCT)/AIG2-like uncharacterized protein YtfP